MTNDDAEYYIDLYDRMTKLVENGIINGFELDPNGKELQISKTIIPKRTLKYVKIDFVITPTGTTFNE
jgi:DNA-binding Lrp family transcriptional regulator